ncbi:MAG: YkgJ family cysteine cluster protein [bacterium]|nr:YkgJ family cysteine cluster protein [bacterium]
MEDAEFTTDVFEALSGGDVRKITGEDHFRFKCTACGNCCKGPGSVYFTPADLKAIEKHLKLRTASERQALRERLVQREENGYAVHRTGGACALLDDDNRCSVYPVRPLQCSTFPFWPSTFASRQDLEDVIVECPGTMAAGDRAKAAARYSPLATARRVNKTRKEFLKPQTHPLKRFMI